MANYFLLSLLTSGLQPDMPFLFFFRSSVAVSFQILQNKFSDSRKHYGYVCTISTSDHLRKHNEFEARRI